MISNKAQTQQVFVYILTVVIVGLIFVFGFRAVNYFLDKGDQVSYIKFKTDIEDKVRILGPKYGTIDRAEFFIGGDFTEICFVDDSPIYSTHNIMNTLVNSGIEENMFLFAGESPEKEYIGRIEVSGDYFCTNIIQGKLRLQFEGKGNRTLITEWPYS